MYTITGQDHDQSAHAITVFRYGASDLDRTARLMGECGYRKTHDLVLVGKAMGHRTIEATRIYVHEDAEALEEALESL